MILRAQMLVHRIIIADLPLPLLRIRKGKGKMTGIGSQRKVGVVVNLIPLKLWELIGHHPSLR